MPETAQELLVDAGLMALIEAKVKGAAGAKFGEWLAKREVMTPLNVTVDDWDLPV